MSANKLGSIHQQEEAVKTRDGLALWVNFFRPDVEIKGTVVIAHGLAEHHERYQHVIKFFLKHGFGVVAYDMRGHGRSEGARCFVSKFSTFSDDLETVLRAIKDPERPIFLLGHSMGSLVVMDFLNRNQGKIPIQAVAVVGMPIKPTVEVSNIKKIFAQIFNLTYPHLALSAGIDSRLLSRDERVGKAYDQDPLVCKKVTVGWYQAFTAAVESVPQSLREINVPALFLHGGDDRIAHPDGSRVMFQVYPCPDKQLHIYEGCYHELLNEEGKEQIMGEILGWFEKHAQTMVVSKAKVLP